MYDMIIVLHEFHDTSLGKASYGRQPLAENDDKENPSKSMASYPYGFELSHGAFGMQAFSCR